MKKVRKSLKLKKRNGNNEDLLKLSEETIQKIKKLVSPNISYNKVKYKSDLYSVGDFLMIRDVADGFLVGKLIKIIQSNGNKKYPYWPTIQVQWYYKKSDINREKNGLIDDALFNSLSDYELFKSNHQDIIFIETVISTCMIYTYEEYESLDDHSETTFFSRASYDPVTELIDPIFSTWEKSCICDLPLNPDQLYIKCDKCEKWFHPKCCDLDENDAQNISEFFCKICRQSLEVN